MKRYVGKHQNRTADARTSQDSAECLEEFIPDYILESEPEISSATPMSAMGTVLAERVRLDDEKCEEEISSQEVRSDTVDFESERNALRSNKHHKQKIGSERKRRLSRFSRFLLIYAAVFLVIIAIGLTFFWKYIAAYEISRPENAMNDLTLLMSDNNGTENLEKYFEVSEFEDKDAVIDKIYSTHLQGQTYTYRKMPGEYSDDSPVYILRSGTTDLFKVNLQQNGDNAAGYGFQLWEVSAIALLKDNAKTITIEAPQSAAVSINGKVVSKDYITEDQVEYENLSKFENDLKDSVYRVLYSIDGIYDEVSVSAVDEQGSELTAETAEGNKFVYGSNRLSVKVTAPADAVISINGIELIEEDITGALVPPELLKGLEKYSNSAPAFVIYEVEGLLKTPEIVAKDASGQELESIEGLDGAVIFGLPDNENLIKEHTQLVTDFIKTYVSFSTNEGDNASGNFSRLSKRLLPNTETYKRIKNSIEGMSWVTDGAIEYRKLAIDDIIPCGNDCFVCRVSLGITVTVDGNVRNTDSIYTLVFVRSGGVWLVGNMDTE